MEWEGVRKEGNRPGHRKRKWREEIEDRGGRGRENYKGTREEGDRGKRK